MRSLFFLPPFLACWLWVGGIAIASTFIVHPDGSGLFQEIQPAIDTANPGDTVLVMPGVYKGPLNRDLDFLGKDICVISAGGSSATTIDCEYSGRGFYLQSGESRAALIRGFHIIHGGGGDRFTCGGIRCTDSSPAIEDIWVEQSDVSNAGGIELLYSSPLIQNSRVESNTVAANAGGLSIGYSDSTVVSNCIVSGNWGSGSGGGVSISHSIVTIDNVHFVDNYAYRGGAIYSWHSEVTILNCTFEGNQAQDGAGIYESDSSLLIQDCDFHGNYATRWGAALYFKDSLGSMVEDCDIQGNNSAYGAIVQIMDSSTPTLRRLSIVDNNHGDGISAGCCYVAGIIEDCLIAFNRGGYGISENPAGLSWVDVSCSNVFGNEYGEYEDNDYTGINGNIYADPLFCEADFSSLGLAQESPCLPPNNSCGVTMGNHGADCTLTSVQTPTALGVELRANYPNPFNPSTTIPFTLDRVRRVSLRIYEPSGRLLRSLIEEQTLTAGSHSYVWNGLDDRGRTVSSGVYFCRLATEAGTIARPMLLVK